MIKLKIDHKNRKTFGTIRNASKRFHAGIRRGLHEIGVENRRHLRKLIRDKNKTGRLYTIRGKIHQASAPGEAPANLTGALANTAGFKVSGHYQCEFGDRQEYGKYLEDGTSKMKPRPHVGRTAEEKERDNYNSLAEHTKEAITKL
jgi:hypothetical protein